MDSHDHINEEMYMTFLCDAVWMAGACNYLGKLDEALTLLQAVEPLFQLSMVWEMDKIEVLLTHAELQVIHSFLTNTDADTMFELTQSIYQQSEESWAATDFAEDMGNAQFVARSLSLLGQAHYVHAVNADESDYSKSSAFFQQALELWEKVAEARKMMFAPFIDNNGDMIDEDIGPYDYALDYATHLIDRQTSKALFFVGLIHESLNEVEQARSYYQRSLDLALHADAKEEASYASSHLANMCEGEDERLELARQSLHWREEIGFKRMLPFSHLQLGTLYLHRNEPEKALEQCLMAFHLANEMNLKRAQMMAFSLQAEIDQHQSKLNEARGHFTQSLSLAEELNLAAHQTRVSEKLAELDSL